MPTPRLLVADSFRVRLNPESGAPEVRGFDSHLERFARTARTAADGMEREVDAFLRDSRERIAAFGAGWPRLELGAVPEAGAADSRLRLQLRPLPPIGDALELRSAGRVELQHPERKGPNLGRLAELNRELGAEALLLDGDDHLVEGATTAILWWQDEALCRSAARARVASVTERLLLAAAARAGIRTVARSAGPDELAHREVWAVNALHGIRVVTRIDGVPLAPPDETRLTRFREALDRTWQAVSAVPD